MALQVVIGVLGAVEAAAANLFGSRELACRGWIVRHIERRFEGIALSHRLLFPRFG